jgi:hypothetical protein
MSPQSSGRKAHVGINGEATMRLSGLSPTAHGTLLALRDLHEIKRIDEAICGELIGHGYARRMDGILQVTERGRKVVPYLLRPSAATVMEWPDWPVTHDSPRT